VKRILRRPGYATPVVYESLLTPDPAPIVNRAERMMVWLQRTPAHIHGDYSRRLAWATARVAEELGEIVVTPGREGETWEEILERQRPTPATSQRVAMPSRPSWIRPGG
jgi:hypothetical protein